MFEPRIIPECHADTLLIKFAGYDTPNHQHSIGQVANLMKTKYFNRKVIKITTYINDIKQKRSPAFLKLQQFISEILDN